MITIIENAKIKANKKRKVKVYRNLRSKVFSIQQTERGSTIVTMYGEGFELLDVEFKVCESQRQRVIDTGQKNVHAKVSGFIGEENINLTHDELVDEGWRLAYYNPYTTDCFIDYITKNRLMRVARVVFIEGKIYYKN
jgi:hypothetical protein